MENIFGNRLRELRKVKKMTQQDLADKLTLSKSLISKYENGAAKPSYEVLEQLAHIFDVSADYLTGKINTYIDDEDKEKQINYLLQKYNKLDQEKRNKLIKILDAFLEL
ncbi:helix-turn-helix transcriptional regulator [Bacillus cytotoxicus]|uniref:helix-turn-helix domain-containing protein n=1 Tax=unclassified Bacillus cereus group TaxID=2750818 RepID=UPI001F5877D0|nr:MULTISPECIES: helix-turn-helix transcriptional regulator [unclassified Bacillus cereus group]EMA6344846.1 helix-turn-helix transcriptional regulator [Bacillus cytotoxicus]